MKKVRWGILGAGGIADRRTMPGMLLADNAEIYAVMEINMEMAEKLRAKYNAAYAYDNEDDLLANPDVDAVYIASPVVCHERQALAAAKAGKNILIEKPISLNAKMSEDIVKYCDDNGIKIGVGLMMRFNTYHQEMKKLIADGKLGQIVSCHAQFTCWYPEIENCWRQQKATAGGGAMTDLGIHCLDLIEYITGSRIVKVGALSDNMTFSYEVEDACSALFKLECGAFGTVDANFNIPDDAARCRIEIYGTKGSIRAEGTIGQIDGGDVLVTLSDTKGYDAMQERQESNDYKMTGADGNMYAREVASFSDSILNGTPVEVHAENAVHIQNVIEAIYKSSETGEFINL